MWLLTNTSTALGAKTEEFYLLGGREYVLGRKNADIVVTGDASISRKHCTFSVVKSVQTTKTDKTSEKLTITDMSKVGIILNGRKMTSNAAVSLKEGDWLRFGAQDIKYKVSHMDLMIVTSCVNSSTGKATVKKCVELLGASTSSTWTDKCSVLVMEKVTFTVKVVCAIACAKPVVSVKYLEDFMDCCDKKTDKTLPNPTEYLPVISEQSLSKQELLFQPNEYRKTLMQGKLFLALLKPQFERIKDVIEFAGGKVVVKDARDVKFVNNIVSDQTIVLQVEKKDEKDATPSQSSWIKEVYAKLKMQKLRPVRESEIGLSIFNVSLEKFCNPTICTPPPSGGSSHTQVMQESYISTQQSQAVIIENNINDATPLVLDDDTQDLFQEPTAKENGSPGGKLKRKREASQSRIESSGNSARDLCKKPKLKDVEQTCAPSITQTCFDGRIDEGDLSEGDGCDEKDEESGRKQNEKDEEIATKQGVIQPHRNGASNIVNIEDEDDEEDVFSFNFSKPCLASTWKDKRDGNKTLDSLNADATLFTNAASNEISQSACLFPSAVAKKSFAPAESCPPSAVNGKDTTDTFLPTGKREKNTSTRQKNYMPESCPTFQKKIITDDEDEEDDPFSFNISTAVCRGKPKPWKSSSTKCGGGGGGVGGEKTEGSESDSSFHVSSTDDERQAARLLKAASSSQCSEAESVLMSDGEGNLMPNLLSPDKGTKQVDKEGPKRNKEGPKRNEEGPKRNEEVGRLKSEEKKNDVAADMSYLLDDGQDDDLDDLDLVSKEFSLPDPNLSIPKGFLSSMSKRPKVNKSALEENLDLVGIDTKNLVKLTLAPLVVDNKNNNNSNGKHKARKTCDVPGSKLKNFKNFKKQKYAKPRQVLDQYQLKRFESHNEERAALFADIVEKDDLEAEENRRIDKMFAAVPSSRKR